MSAFKPSFEVASVESMQWNRTINLDMLTQMSGDPGREDAERQAVERGEVELPADALDRVRDVIRQEAEKVAGSEVEVDVEIRRTDAGSSSGA